MQSSASVSPVIAPLPRIILIGVGHVFNIKAAVKDAIIRSRPQVVALELDPARFQALISKERGDGGSMPLIYSLLARFQRDLAQQFGTEAGGEMIAAAEAASQVGARVALIDMDAAGVFARMNREMSIREKILMAVGAVMTVFTRKSTVEKELDTFMSNEEKFMVEMKRAYPSVVRVLIEERNEHMARQLKEISKTSPLTVAVVGDGHVSGLTALISSFSRVEVERLSQLQKEQVSAAPNSEMTVSFVVSGEGKT